MVDPIAAVDKDGKPVDESAAEIFQNFFSLNASTGDVFVANKLDRNVAATVTIKIQATDNSASPPQHGFGNLVNEVSQVVMWHGSGMEGSSPLPLNRKG